MEFCQAALKPKVRASELIMSAREPLLSWTMDSKLRGQ